MRDGTTIPAKLAEQQDNATPPEHQRAAPEDLMVALRGLHASKIISREALFLGCHICAIMADRNVEQVIIRGDEITGKVLRYEGALVAGPISPSLVDYAQALQELHFRAGLLNDIYGHETYSPEMAQRHFTLSPTLTPGRSYGIKTPIYYQIIPYSREQLLRSVNKMMAEKLYGNTVIDWE